MIRHLTVLILAPLCVWASNAAFAATITYEFSAAVSLETRNNMLATPDQRFFSDGTLISGLFDYDNGLMDGFPAPTGGTFYPALSNLTGMIAGNDFSDAQGAVGVINNGFDFDPGDPNNDLVDLMILVADTGAPGDTLLSGFTVENGGTTFALVNVRLFWIADGTDYYDDESLPATLPPGLGIARMALDFADVDNPDNRHIVFAEPLTVTAVPLPAAAWLFLSAAGALGWVGRARR